MKPNSKIAAILREHRNKLHLSGKQVTSILKNEYKIEISEKTLLGYESSVGTPRVNTFLALCKIYHITDVMQEFGYSTPLKLATGESEWTYDEYNDFFKGNLLEKIYLLLKKGVPSFSGYEKQLEECFPPNARMANFDRLYNLFSSLDEASQTAVFHTIDDLKGNPYGCVKDIDFITLFHRACKTDQDIILALLDKYRDKPLEEYLGYSSAAPGASAAAEALYENSLGYARNTSSSASSTTEDTGSSERLA